jgi:lysozyme
MEAQLNIVEQLRRDEGVRYSPYQDSLGYWTVGCGHKILPTDHFHYPMTDAEVDQQLEYDITDKVNQLRLLPWFNTLDECRQGVIVNMAFNMGVAGLLTFVTTIHLISIGDYNGAHQHMLQSLWAKQVGPRANRLADQLVTGAWQ